MAYQGKNFDPNYRLNQSRSPKQASDRVLPKKPPRLGLTTPPKRCFLVGADGSRQPFESKTDAKRALAALILALPPKASKDEPDQYWIE